MSRQDSCTPTRDLNEDLGDNTDGFQDAAIYYKTLLDTEPCNFFALARLIIILKCQGRLCDASGYIQAAEKACNGLQDQEAGLRYCRGKLYHLRNKPRDALVELNFASQHPDYQAYALTHMIEILLSPNSNAGIESLDASTEPNLDDLREVDNLIEKLEVVAQQAFLPRLRVYKCQSLIFTKNKASVEKALAQLLDMDDINNNVPALLAMSEGCIVQNNMSKARNQLKRIADSAKRSYNAEYADYFEKACLLLSEIWIQQGKYDLASNMCFRVKDHNRSCCKAWQHLGLIYEKEQAYRDACAHYEKAWELCNQSLPSVEHHLAFNYLKSKQVLKAIDWEDRHEVDHFLFEARQDLKLSTESITCVVREELKEARDRQLGLRTAPITCVQLFLQGVSEYPTDFGVSSLGYTSFRDLGQFLRQPLTLLVWSPVLISWLASKSQFKAQISPIWKPIIVASASFSFLSIIQHVAIAKQTDLDEEKVAKIIGN